MSLCGFHLLSCSLKVGVYILVPFIVHCVVVLRGFCRNSAIVALETLPW